MSLLVKRASELLDPSKLRLKILVYGPSGFGKTMFASTAPNACFAACETGHGGGIMTVANSESNPNFVQPDTYQELEQFCSGHVCKESDSLVIDGFSYLTDTVIKDYALTVPRQQGNSKKRDMGILELDDYGTLAELERRLLAKLLSQDKHVIVTCLQDYYQPAQSSPPRPEKIGGPDLPGMMRLGSSAMFDIVLRLFTRPMLRDPKDPKSSYQERVFQTTASSTYLAKSRLRTVSGDIFPAEVVFDLDKKTGTFDWFLAKALEGYVKAHQDKS